MYEVGSKEKIGGLECVVVRSDYEDRIYYLDIKILEDNYGIEKDEVWEVQVGEEGKVVDIIDRIK